MRVSLLFSVLLLFFGMLPLNLTAQTADETGPDSKATVISTEEEKEPEDALKRGTPRGSMRGFVEACDDFDFERASEYLDLSGLPEEVAAIGGSELARQFNQVLSRSVSFDDFSLSNKPEGLSGDGLPGDRDELVRINGEGGEVILWLQRVPRSDGELIWKLSNRSVAQIPGLYRVYSYRPATEWVRSWFPHSASFLGVDLFKWFIALMFGLLAWPILHLAGVALTRLLSTPSSPSYSLVRRIMTRPLVALGVLLVIILVLQKLGLGGRAQQIAEARTGQIIVFIWVIWSIANLFRNHQQDKLTAQGRPGAARLMRPMTTFFKILVLVLAVLFWLNNIGVNITTVLAGLGVGGLAVALALQRPIEDLMGALTIFSQAPLRVGDFVRYGEVFGTVEDIGLRTTRLRTITNSVVSVPNALIAHREIENLSYRTKIRYAPTLRLRYDTSPEQLRKITTTITAMLAENERVHDEPIRAHVTDFSDDAILVKVHSFLKTTEVADSLEIGEQLNVRIMEIVRGAGARFALPGRSIQLEGGGTVTST